ncbi:ammonium transporter [Candidatus Marinamargulisbacteria bacterium SCGC AG-343-K17]|nr:ammonium transporter [Candidatus Marinamargulisbacteria bacterium SCGC AG-343-K17]
MSEIQLTISNLWILIATAMVFIMHLGFAALEAGFTRSKNTVNILFKNIGVISIGLLSFALIGYSLMYPGDAFSGGVFGFSGFGLPFSGDAANSTNANYTFYTDFIFQAMFAATAATIVSGAIAERMKLSAFLIFSLLLVGVSYPITGMWKWGGGFLDSLTVPFYDFAGSTLVHSVGGWAALVAAIMIGPRLGRYDGSNSIRPHSFALSTIGVLLLWFGWFGFNGGSVLSADPFTLSLVFVTTALGGAAGVAFAMGTSWLINKRPDLANTLNGSLAGLVGVTASADIITPLEAVLIGSVAGVLVVFSAKIFDSLRVDDPVGAISVHLVCGVWGTLAVGLFGAQASGAQFISQLIGVLSVGAFTVTFSLAILKLIKIFIGLRVSADHEEEGLDKAEHKDMSYFYSHVNS